MTRAKLIEQGNGLPADGELVYHHESDQLYRVQRSSGIHTDGYRGNYVYADLEKDGQTVLTEKEYDSFSVDVELLADEADADDADPSPRQIRALRQEAGEHGDMEMVKICDQALAGDQGAIDEVARVRADARAADC